MTAGDAAAAKRVALVIGNSAYQHAEELPNPRNDAKAIAEALTRAGFEVDLRTDLDQLGMQHALRDFGLKAEGADAAVVFYAGHGVQVAGENYLLPIDATLERERDLLYEALPLNLVMGEVGQAQRLGLVIIDACRDNPLAEQLRRVLGPIRSRLVGDGMARMDNLPSNTMIAFATRPGEVAVDGNGAHSPYTAALLTAHGGAGPRAQPAVPQGARHGARDHRLPAGAAHLRCARRGAVLFHPAEAQPAARAAPAGAAPGAGQRRPDPARDRPADGPRRRSVDAPRSAACPPGEP